MGGGDGSACWLWLGMGGEPRAFRSRSSVHAHATPKEAKAAHQPAAQILTCRPLCLRPAALGRALGAGKQWWAELTRSQPWRALPLHLFCRYLSSPRLRPAPFGDMHTGTAGLGLVWFISNPLYFRMSMLICTGERTREQHTQHREENTCSNLTMTRKGLYLIHPGVSSSSIGSPVLGCLGSRGHKGVRGAGELASSQDPDLWAACSRMALGQAAPPRS